MRDLPELGMSACGIDERLALAGHQAGSGQQNVAALQEIVHARGCGVARLRDRLTGDGRRVDPDTEGFDQPAVGGDVVALLKDDDVAHHKLLDWQKKNRAVTHDFCLLRQELLQRGERPLNPVLLPERKQTADDNDCRDHVADLRHAFARLGPFRHEGQPCGNPQNDGKEPEELAKKSNDRGLALALLDAVWPVFRKAPRSLARREALRPAAHDCESLAHR